MSDASIEVQRVWRGWTGRKRTRWVHMEREGRRRLLRLQKEVEQDRKLARALATRDMERYSFRRKA